MRNLIFILILNWTIYFHEIPFIWRFVKKNILCYYVLTGDRNFDREVKELLRKSIEEYWNPYFPQVGYNVELVDGGAYDISVM